MAVTVVLRISIFLRVSILGHVMGIKPPQGNPHQYGAVSVPPAYISWRLLVRDQPEKRKGHRVSEGTTVLAWRGNQSLVDARKTVSKPGRLDDETLPGLSGRRITGRRTVSVDVRNEICGVGDCDFAIEVGVSTADWRRATPVDIGRDVEGIRYGDSAVAVHITTVRPYVKYARLHCRPQ